jgi:hypothetical protein|tara:strand:- start:360 stop:491 length:132 start_codon:yes stop_codon:yes gene_type:complete
MKNLNLTTEELQELSYLLLNLKFNLNTKDYDSIIDKINEVENK